MNDMKLNANVNIDTAAATRALNATARGATEFAKRLREGNIAAAEYAATMPKLALATQRAQKTINDAELATARVRKTNAETQFTIVKTTTAQAEAEARAVARAESEKRRQYAETAKSQAQSVARNRTSTGNPSSSGSSYVANNLSAALGYDNQVKNELKSMGDFYRNALPDVGHLNQTRYALYDVASTLAVFGGALVAAGAASVTFGVQYETAMAQVQRTTQLEANSRDLQQLKADLLALAGDIPVGFTDLAGIASLGAQLGIANEDLDQFTETVAQFAAVTGVSTEAVAQDFGALAELLNVPSSEFENLGSAVNFVGVNSVATDNEILKLSTSIAASATQAGFAASETLGLAGALASLRIQPEQARGVILRLFADFDRVVSEGGVKLEQYAAVLGVTTQQATALWETDAEGFFDKLVKGLSVADDLNGTLTQLGIVETRESNVLQRLAGNYDLYATSIQQANSAYADGTFLGESYGIVAETTAAKIQTLINKIQTILASAGDGIITLLGPVIALVSTVVDGIALIPAPILSAVAAIGLLAGGLLLVVAAGAAFIASGFAVQTALRGLTEREGETITLGLALRQTITQLTTAMGINSTAARINSVSIASLVAAKRGAVASTTAHTTAVGAEAVALRGTTVATTGAAAATRTLGATLAAVPIVGWIAALVSAVPIVLSFVAAVGEAENQAREAREAFITAGGGMEAFQAALQADTAAGLAEGYGTLQTKVSGLGAESLNAAQAARTNAQRINELTGANLSLAPAVNASGDALVSQTLVLGKNTQAFVENALANNDAVKNLAANADQMEALTKAFDINFPDLIAASLKNDGSFEQQVKEIRATMDDLLLNADVNGIAGGYGAALEASDNFNTIITAIDGYRKSAEEASTVRSILGLPGVAADAEILASTGQSVASTIEALTDGVQKGSAAFFGFDNIIGSVQSGLKDWAEEQAAATDSSEDSWEDYYDGTSVSLQQFSDKLADQITAQQAWANDLATLSAAGATSFVSELASMGPEGAALAAQAVDLTADQLGELEGRARLAGFLASPAFAAGFAENNELLNEAYEKGGIEAVQRLIDAQISGAPGAVGQVITALNAEFGGRPIQIPTEINPSGAYAGLEALVRDANGRYTISVNASVGQSALDPYRPRADGGIEEYARGGIREGIYKGRPKGLIKFAEPETGWEAFISGKMSERTRNIGLWGEAGRRLGIDAAPVIASSFSNGGSPSSGFSTGATATPIQQGGTSSGPLTVVNATVNQYNPVTRDPIKTMKQDTESVVSGIWL